MRGGGEKGGRAAKTEKREAKREEQRGWEDRLSWTGCGRLYNEIFYWVRLGLCWQQATCILVQFKFEPLLVKFRSPRTTKDMRAAGIGISTTILEASGKQIWILFPWLHTKKKKKNSFCFQCCPSTSVWQQNKLKKSHVQYHSYAVCSYTRGHFWVQVIAALLASHLTPPDRHGE